MVVRAILLSCLAAAPAWAACPVAADLATGIRLVDQNGVIETYRTLRPHVVELIVDYGDEYSDRVSLARGVYTLDVVEEYNGVPDFGTRSTYAYQVAPEAMPLPTPGGVWRTRARVDDTYDDKMTASWGDPTTMTYGECTYAVIPGELVYTGEGYSQTEGLHYLPDLGIAYLSTFSTDADGVVDTYTVVTISAVGDDG